MSWNKTAALCGAFLVASATAFGANAQQMRWKGEITPYLWAAGIDAEATVAGQTVKIDKGFSDLLDASDVGGSLLGVFQYGPWVLYGQMDYLSLSTDELENPPAPGRLDADTRVLTLAAGYQFQGARGKTYDLLLGVRQLKLDQELQLNGIGTFSRDRDINDVVVVFRPSIPLSQRWRFNPTMSFGKGDSESTYELWPQFQYQFAQNWAGRIGYRRLFYDIENENGNKWDGAFQGVMIGLGGTW